jgi:DNA-binding transcriptional MerR regulator
MMTVSQLARRCGLSRSTILYYESRGLLCAASRGNGNYRQYSQKELERLERIRLYRGSGLGLSDIAELLRDQPQGAAAVLERRLGELEEEMAVLREHRQAILRLLRAADADWREEMISKEKWVSIMRNAGFSEEEMMRWHAQFERDAPDEHEEFLRFLHISAAEIAVIREKSRRQ